MWWFILLFALLIPLAAVVLDSQLGRALAGLIERQACGREVWDEERLQYLESEVERLNKELRRLAEHTDFLERLLAERPNTQGSIGVGKQDE